METAVNTTNSAQDPLVAVWSIVSILIKLILKSIVTGLHRKEQIHSSTR